MYFEKEENIVFAPLKNAHKGDTIWQKAYQTVKHSRVENLYKANIRVLLRIMAALYILNIYYRNDSLNADDLNEFNPAQGSELFIVNYGDVNNKTELEKYVILIAEDSDYADKVEIWAENCPVDLREVLNYEKLNPTPKRYKITLNKLRNAP